MLVAKRCPAAVPLIGRRAEMSPARPGRNSYRTSGSPTGFYCQTRGVAGSEAVTSTSAGITAELQRRGRDSNPRAACATNGFRDRPVQPLRHPSEGDEPGYRQRCVGLQLAPFGRPSREERPSGHETSEAFTRSTCRRCASCAPTDDSPWGESRLTSVTLTGVTITDLGDDRTPDMRPCPSIMR